MIKSIDEESLQDDSIEEVKKEDINKIRSIHRIALQDDSANNSPILLF